MEIHIAKCKGNNNLTKRSVQMTFTNSHRKLLGHHLTTISLQTYWVAKLWRKILHALAAKTSITIRGTIIRIQWQTVRYSIITIILKRNKFTAVQVCELSQQIYSLILIWTRSPKTIITRLLVKTEIRNKCPPPPPLDS